VPDHHPVCGVDTLDEYEERSQMTHLNRFCVLSKAQSSFKTELQTI